MVRSSKGWSRSPSSNLWLPEPSRRTVLSGVGAGAAALLLGCGRDGSATKGGLPTEEGGAGGAGMGGAGTGGAPGSGGSGVAKDAGATGGSGGMVSPDAAAQAGIDASGPADSLLQSDGMLIMPDGSMIPADANGQIPALACTKRSEQIVGPFPAANVQLNRSDIRSDPADGDKVKGGVPLQVVFRVGTKGMLGCSPLKGAIVNGWQCDSAGLYGAYASEGTAGKQYLRGYQATDESGVAVFQTIYPGSYSGRCVHFHFSVRMSSAQSFPGGAFVGQLYFPDEITDEVLTHAGYNKTGRVKNAQDDFYKSDMLGKVTKTATGYIAELELAI